MRRTILIVTPAAQGSRKGNRITAERLARLITGSEFRVRITDHYKNQNCDLLIALHARKSSAAISRFSKRWPERPCVLVLTGTDLYHDIASSRAARRSLDRASQIVLLQPHGVRFLDRSHQTKATAIIQSAERLTGRPRPSSMAFSVCVVGHLRPVKDPFRTAMAARLTAKTLQLRVIHIGKALSPSMKNRAEREMAVNPRYQWLGELSHSATIRKLRDCQLLVLTSQLEGGANVISEAIVNGVPVVSTRISGSIGLLGDDYPGFFEFGDTPALSQLLTRAETDPEFLNRLRTECSKLRPQFHPRREASAWRKLLRESLKP